MSVLLKEIRQSDKNAASVLEEAGFCTDSELQSLTREDLNELFPGRQKLKLRKSLFEIIHKQKPISVLLTALRGLLPHESIRAALTNDGVLVDYLHILKDMKAQMNHVQTFLDAHIDLLEKLAKEQQQEPHKGSSGPVFPSSSQTQGQPQRDQGSSGPGVPSHSQIHSFSHKDQEDWSVHDCQKDLPAVRYRMVLGGKTFDAHTQLMDKVKTKNPNGSWLVESNEDYQIIIVFCPLSSRLESDVKAVLCQDKWDKPVILVLMHHTFDAKQTLPRTTLRQEYQNIVLQVNTLFHHAESGLLKCQQNNEAVAAIQNKLLEYYSPERKYTSGNVHGGGGCEAHRDGDGGSGRRWGFGTNSFSASGNSHCSNS